MSKQQDTQNKNANTKDETSALKSPQMLIVEELIKAGAIDKNDPRLKTLYDIEAKILDKSVLMQKIISQVREEYGKRPDQLVEFFSGCAGFVADTAIDEIINGKQPNLSSDLQRLIGATIMYDSLVNNVLKVVEIASSDLQTNIASIIDNEARNGNFNEGAKEILKDKNSPVAQILKNSVQKDQNVQSSCCGDTEVHSDAPKPPS